MCGDVGVCVLWVMFGILLCCSMVFWVAPSKSHLFSFNFPIPSYCERSVCKCVPVESRTTVTVPKQYRAYAAGSGKDQIVVHLHDGVMGNIYTRVGGR